tara:strand:- start:636 stop:911 length:276 start_codon:yes stop_codon:yes gene_type:complete
MGVLLLVAIGGVLGYMACLTIGRGSRDMAINVIVGMFGALLAALLFSPYFGLPTMFGGDISIASFVLSLIGSVIALGVLNVSIVSKRRRAD